MGADNVLGQWGLKLGELTENTRVPARALEDIQGLDKLNLLELAIVLPDALPIHAAVVELLERKSETFRDWAFLFSYHCSSSALRERALQRLVDLAQSFEELFQVCQALPSGSPARAEFFRRMCVANADVSEWFRVYSHTSNGDALHAYAQKRVLELSQRFEDALTIFNQLQFGDPLKAEMRKKIKILA